MKKDLDLGWFDLKKTLQNADRKELINLIRDLYRLSEENRRYLLAGGKSLYSRFKKQLFDIRKETKMIGWGFGDDVNFFVKDVEDFFEEGQRDS